MTRPRTFRMNDGRDIPVIGIGFVANLCWMGLGFDGGKQAVVEMVLHALKVGYRHIDTAFNYYNEDAVGEAIRLSGIPRQDIFVTTKLAGEFHGSVEEGLQRSLENLGLEYVDLFLMHWPQALTPQGTRSSGTIGIWTLIAFGYQGDAIQPTESPTFCETWKEMEKLVASGKVKTIGVSNFSIKNLDILLRSATIVPAINQARPQELNTIYTP
ncbi:hypothetical protein NLI96_g6425 [Meripilus lineatus]|uniref:NADP-dependent oxidoreductase domain-containing protein n=1 Tax=Meripilus lineatus TaxID=2056292 RepID=A0AAD5V2W9_9APHY|nr:hypothetical protein NLI96_g6425 [Physisporinus lineatus]